MPLFTLTHSADTFPTGGQDNSGDDTIVALSGRDLVNAGDGDDSIDGGSDSDTLYGGSGNDTVNAGILPGEEVMDGGVGDDIAVVRYENVINVGTQFSVRIVAVYSTSPFTTLVDGFLGASLSNFEHIYITSGNNDDSLVGGGGDDFLVSLGGNDVLRGGAGDDHITKTYGAWTDIDGGTGTDLLTALNTDNDAATGGLVFDARGAVGTIASGGGTSGSFRNFEQYEIEGTEKADRVYTGALSDSIYGLDGHDSLYGGDGNDDIFGDAGNDFLYGGNGDDDLDGGPGIDVVEGGLGDDLIFSGFHTGTVAADADKLRGDDGNDIVIVNLPGTGTGTLTFAGAVYDGGAGDDILEFDAGTAILDITGATIRNFETLAYGTIATSGMFMSAALLNALTNLSTGGFVQIVGNTAVVLDGAILTGGQGFRLADGGQSFNASAATSFEAGSGFFSVITGGNGNDAIAGSGLRDRIFGGDGDDLIRGNGTGVGADILVGGAGNDSVTGGAAADLIDGGDGLDLLTGGTGRDTMLGGAGSDTISAGGGNDVVVGGTGKDIQSGGAGNDIFVFENLPDSGANAASADVIQDFQLVPALSTAYRDRIDISLIEASAANGTFAFIGTAAFDAEGQVRLRQLGADTIVELNTSGTTGAEMSIRLVGINATLVEASDFLL